MSLETKLKNIEESLGATLLVIFALFLLVIVLGAILIIR